GPPAPSRSTNSAKEAMRPSLISSFDPSPGPWRWRRGEHPALGFHRWLCARGMNDALHGREAWRPPGKRDRGRRREMGSRVSAHHGPGEATLTPLILVRIRVPQPNLNCAELAVFPAPKKAALLPDRVIRQNPDLDCCRVRPRR